MHQRRLRSWPGGGSHSPPSPLRGEGWGEGVFMHQPRLRSWPGGGSHSSPSPSSPSARGPHTMWGGGGKGEGWGEGPGT